MTGLPISSASLRQLLRVGALGWLYAMTYCGRYEHGSGETPITSCLSACSPRSSRGCLEASCACTSHTILSCSNGTSPSQLVLQALQKICFPQQARPLDIAWQLLAFNRQDGDVVCLICLPIVHVPAEDEEREQDGHLCRSTSELSLH